MRRRSVVVCLGAACAAVVAALGACGQLAGVQGGATAGDGGPGSGVEAGVDGGSDAAPDGDAAADADAAADGDTRRPLDGGCDAAADCASGFCDEDHVCVTSCGGPSSDCSDGTSCCRPQACNMASLPFYCADCAPSGAPCAPFSPGSCCAKQGCSDAGFCN